MHEEAKDGSFTMEFDGFIAEQDFALRWRLLMFVDLN